MAERKKHGGRQKGTPNKVTNELRQWVAKLIDDNRKQIEKDLKSLCPEKRITILERFLQYVLPKRQQVRAEIESLTDSELSQLAETILTQMGYDDNQVN